jgi:predicted RNA-binding protein YlxR (DUF448 family)
MWKEKGMSEKGHLPIRTCIGCRRKRKKGEMLRFVHTEERIVFVRGKKAVHGRGFYLCPDILCFKMAKKRNRWIDSLRSMDLSYPLVKGLQ